MITTIEGGSSSDSRGTVRFVNNFTFENVKRFYMVENIMAGFARDWHGHMKETIYACAAAGRVLLGVVRLDTDEAFRFMLDGNVPKIVCIPPGCASSFKPLTDGARMLFFSTATLEDSISDSMRYPLGRWNVLDDFGEGDTR